VSRFSDELFFWVEPVGYADAENDDALRAIVEGISAPFEEIDDLVRDTDDGPGWSALVDADRAPAKFLPWLAYLNGVRVTASYTEAQQRAEIVDAAGFRRGTTGAMIAQVQTHLTGLKRVVLIERDLDPYKITVMTYASETPNPTLTEKDARARKPAGLVLNYVVNSGWAYEPMRIYYLDPPNAPNTYANLASDHASYAALLAFNP
jgi:hypothetical protein